MSDATEDAGRHFGKQMTHVGHVVFDDQLIFGRPFALGTTPRPEKNLRCWTVVCLLPWYIVAKRYGFEPNNVLWAFHTIQPSSIVYHSGVQRQPHLKSLMHYAKRSHPRRHANQSWSYNYSFVQSMQCTESLTDCKTLQKQ